MVEVRIRLRDPQIQLAAETIQRSGARALFVNGFSGHGVMYSTASGRITPDLILHGHSDLIDAAQLSFLRFAAGQLLEETSVL